MSSDKKRIFLSPPHIGEAERALVMEAFASNWIAPLGPHVDAFEQEFCDYVKSSAAVALSSCTAAIHLALRVLNIGQGDIVFCSSLTFVASVNPVLYQQATPVFIDSEPDTWNMSPIALQRALEDAHQAGQLPKAVIVVHLYGQSADMEAIVELCDRFEVPIVEDAAESLGATFKGAASGTIGRFGTFSFNGNKIITTSGGGMLVSNDRDAINRARFMATQSRDPAPHYEHSEIGYNYRLSNVCAAIGRGQLNQIQQRVEARRSVFRRYEEAFAGVQGIKWMPESEKGYCNRWLTALTLDPREVKVQPDQLIEALAMENIEARPVWKPMHLQPLFEGCSYYTHHSLLDLAKQLFHTGLCLPSGSSLTEEEQQRVIDCVLRTLSS